MDIKIIVAAHKKYWMPSDPIYLPVHVGAEGKTDENGKALELGFCKDNTGENISAKNANYCELTGLFWAYKNLPADYLGLVHYRRYFCAKGSKGSWKDRVLTGEQLAKILEVAPVVLPKKRNYFIESNYQQYIHAHHEEDLIKTREILAEKYPEYLKDYDSLMKKTSGHRFNIFIMRRDLADAYCGWLFDILFELEKRLDISEYSPYDARVFGFVSERLLDVWINYNDIAYTELPYVFSEKQNWLKKGSAFLYRKFIGKK